MPEATQSSINELLGQRTDISDINVNSPQSLDRVAFDLYKEATIVAVASSNLYESDGSEEDSVLRNQAIEMGLLIRIAKFMSAVMALTLDKAKEHGEVILALNRCITESAIKSRFFSEKATQKDFDDFVKSSLGPEKELRLTIMRNINNRESKVLPIEARMLRSIDRVFQNSGIKKISELDTIPRFASYRKILKKLGIESTHPMLQGIPSHAIHGNWVDLVQHHLKKSNNGFSPKSESITPDARQLLPTSVVVLTAIKSYINKYFSRSHSDILSLSSRIDDLILKSTKVDSLHESYLASRVAVPDRDTSNGPLE